MATTLLLATNNANESLSKIFYPTCVSWNNTMEQWKYSIKPTKGFLLHLLTSIILQLNILIAVLFTVYCAFYEPDMFPLRKLQLVSALLVCCGSWSFLDCFLIFCGQEMVSIANWATVCIKKLKLFPRPKRHSNIVKELCTEIQKVTGSNSEVDFFGIAAGYAFVSCAAILCIISFTVVISDADILYLAIVSFCSIFNLNSVWLYSWYLYFIRFLVFMNVYQCVTVVAPTFAVVSAAIVQGLIYTLNFLKRGTLTYENTKLFKNIFVAKCLVFNMLKWFNSIFLSGAFFVFLLTTNLSFYGKTFLPGHLYILILLVASTMLWFTAFILYYENFSYKSSCYIIKRWKSQLALGVAARPKYIRLIVSSLQPIAIPVGDIGIVDTDIEINYFSAVLTYVVNTSVIFKNFF